MGGPLGRFLMRRPWTLLVALAVEGRCEPDVPTRDLLREVVDRKEEVVEEVMEWRAEPDRRMEEPAVRGRVFEADGRMGVVFVVKSNTLSIWFLRLFSFLYDNGQYGSLVES